MIYSFDKKYIFISIPKAATVTMFSVLQEKYAGKRVLGGFHVTRVPFGVKKKITDWRDWTVFTVCRNPFSRAVSLWKYVTLEKHWKTNRYRICDILREGPEDFLGFSEFLRSVSLRNPMQIYKSMSRYLLTGDQGKITHTLKIESLNEDFNQLPFMRKEPKIDLPVQNITVHKDYKTYYTPKIEENIRIWAGEDFNRFGYESTIGV